jgi:hypothetical protein
MYGFRLYKLCQISRKISVNKYFFKIQFLAVIYIRLLPVKG